MNPYKVHCLFVRANDRRAVYDYFMLVCGPLRAKAQLEAREGPMNLIGADGRICRNGAATGGDAADAHGPHEAGIEISGTDRT
jgi:hypothetical protein